jgi:hypothetical protein
MSVSYKSACVRYQVLFMVQALPPRHLQLQFTINHSRVNERQDFDSPKMGLGVRGWGEEKRHSPFTIYH